MKYTVSIIWVVISALILLFFSTLPHHHDEEMCIVMDHHEQESTSDEGCCNHENHPESCVTETEYILFRLNDKTKYTILSCQDHELRSFYIYSALADFFNLRPESAVPKAEYGQYICSYKPVKASLSHYLRGPPASL